MREWSSYARLGYPIAFGDATASGAALALLISRRYSFRTLGGSADVHSLKQISSRIRIGGALSRRANGPCPSRPRGSQAGPSASVAIQPPARTRTFTATFRALTAVTPEAAAFPICATIFRTAGLSAAKAAAWV